MNVQKRQKRQKRQAASWLPYPENKPPDGAHVWVATPDADEAIPARYFDKALTVPMFCPDSVEWEWRTDWQHLTEAVTHWMIRQVPRPELPEDGDNGQDA